MSLKAGYPLSCDSTSMLLNATWLPEPWLWTARYTSRSSLQPVMWRWMNCASRTR